MARELNINRFIAAINNCNNVSTEEVQVRRLLNITSKENLSIEDIKFIESINSNIFLVAYKELNQKSIDSMPRVKDMVVYEYAKENIQSTDIYEDEEDIY